MSSIDTTACRCTACPGDGCACGCQAAAPRQADGASCACGSDCRCSEAGGACACGTPAVGAVA